RTKLLLPSARRSNLLKHRSRQPRRPWQWDTTTRANPKSPPALGQAGGSFFNHSKIKIMSKWKYTGPDRELPGFGKVGHTSVLEATGAQIEELGPTFFEKVGDKELQSIVPWGSVPFTPDVTGLTSEESEAAAAK